MNQGGQILPLVHLLIYRLFLPNIGALIPKAGHGFSFETMERAGPKRLGLTSGTGLAHLVMVGMAFVAVDLQESLQKVALLRLRKLGSYLAQKAF